MRIAICLPMASGRLCWQTHESLMREVGLLTEAGHVVFEVKVPGCSLVHMARNEAVHLALEGNADRVVFIDDDMGWEMGAILKLVSQPVDFVAAACPYRRPGPIEWNVRWLDAPSGRGPNGLIEVHCVGAAIVSLSSAVFDRLRSRLGDQRRYISPGREQESARFAYYECPGPWGEDMRFCQEWRDAGGKVWICPDIEVEHVVAPHWSVKGRLSDWLNGQRGASASWDRVLAALNGPHGRAAIASTPPTISLLVPTRGRPEKALRYMQSAVDTAARPDALEIILGVDEDDTTAADLERWNNDVAHGARVTLVTEPRFPTLGALIDNLHSYARGEIIGWGVDDVTFVTPGWDDITRKAVAGEGVWYPEYLGEKDFCIAPFMTREFVEKLRDVQGYICQSFFPYWFNDTWFDEIGDLIGSRHLMAWEYGFPDGGEANGTTGGRRDLGFWAQFFEQTRTLRVQTASKLVSPEDKLQVLLRARRCAEKRAHLQTPAFLRKWGDADAAAPTARYLAVKARAESLIPVLRQHEKAA